ncbi:MAG: START-like domain-containing protein [Bacteroidota bacterium]
MAKYKFTNEYEIRASTKMLYPYLSTPAGLQDWFADKVITEDKLYHFEWDDEIHTGRIVSQRVNKSIKFEFEEEEEGRPSYIEFKLEANEMTESSFLKITDYSSANNEEDLHKFWDGLVGNLRELVGG